nr:NADH dehydrogenase subunit 1 [Megacampsomeris sp. 1 YJY-2023a]
MYKIISIIMMIILVLMSVAFLTLLERSILSYIQNRTGPMKVGLLGYLQPFSDAVKLFKKELIILDMSNIFFYFISPLIMLLIVLMSWLIYPWFMNIYSLKFNILYFIACMMLNIYPLIYSGWSSGCHYSMLGAVRAVAQMISYEVSFMILIMNMVILTESFNLKDFHIYQENTFMFMIIMFPIFIMYFLSILVELNRTPFDLVEGESELVSGFNTEYFSSLFALIFMSEYSSILFMSMIMVLIFTGKGLNSLYFYLFYLLFIYLILIIRGVTPRMRYDKMMMMCWKIILPISLSHFLLIYGIKMLIMSLIY